MSARIRPLPIPIRPLLDRLVASRSLELRPIPPSGTEPRLLAALGAPVPERATLVDVGANIGQTATRLARHYPTASVLAFEPVSSTFATLQVNAAPFPNIRCIHAGVSDASGTLEMSAVPNSEINRVVAGTSEGPVEQVPCLRLDDYAAEHGIDDIFLLKTDTEGHDIAVLRGAEQLLRTSVRAVFCETGLRPDDTDHTPLAEVQALLGPLGFVLRGVYEVGYDADGAAKFINALFVR